MLTKEKTYRRQIMCPIRTIILALGRANQSLHFPFNVVLRRTRIAPGSTAPKFDALPTVLPEPVLVPSVSLRIFHIYDGFKPCGIRKLGRTRRKTKAFRWQLTDILKYDRRLMIRKNLY